MAGFPAKQNTILIILLNVNSNVNNLYTSVLMETSVMYNEKFDFFSAVL